MHGEICRLCLQSSNGNYQPIENSLIDTLKLDMNISGAAVKCIECTNNLEVFLKFKSACDYITENTLSTDSKDIIDVDTKDIETTSNLLPPMESRTEKRCCFCTKSSEKEGLTSINESKEHKILMDVLKQYIPKLNSNITELLTCETCLDGLQGVLHFLMKCKDVEQKINEYSQIKKIVDKGQIDLRNVQQLITKLPIKSESKDVNVSNKGCIMRTEAETKYGKIMGNPKLIIKTEAIDIKSEHSDCERFQENPITEIDKDSLDIPVWESQRHKKCVNQSNAARANSSVKTSRDTIKHKPYDKLKSKVIFKCKLCPYGAQRQVHLKAHELGHKSTSEVTMFKCDLCVYETKYEHALKRHRLAHENSSKVQMFKDEICTFETKLRSYTRRHELIHKSASEVTVFECDQCSYEAKNQACIKRHKTVHKITSETTMFKCELCPYETKYRYNLKKHKLTHTVTSDKTFKCKLCPYETKYKFTLRKHNKLTHEDTAEFKCEECGYKAKYKHSLAQHVVTHKSPSEVTMFKCELCLFETKYKNCLVRHVSTHKSSSEATMFKCELCLFETKHQGNINRHKVSHESATKNGVFA